MKYQVIIYNPKTENQVGKHLEMDKKLVGKLREWIKKSTALTDSEDSNGM